MLFTLSLANVGGSELGKQTWTSYLFAARYSAGYMKNAVLHQVKKCQHSSSSADFGAGFLHPGATFYHPADPETQHWIDKYFYPKQLLLSSRKYDPRCLCRIPDPDFYHPESGSRIQGSKKCVRSNCFLILYVDFESFQFNCGLPGPLQT
jgi:hypothetical protein